MASQDAASGCLTASVDAIKLGGQPYTTLHIRHDNVPMKFKVDTGAEIKVLPITAFDKLAESRTKQLKPTRVRLTGYVGQNIPTTGTCKIECFLKGNTYSLEFFIADTNATHSIGFDSCRAMGLERIDRILEMRWPLSRRKASPRTSPRTLLRGIRSYSMALDNSHEHTRCKPEQRCAS